MATHTPGPWTVEEYGDRDCPALVLHSDSETRVCFMATPGSKGDPARIAADARLIAAAPDLLEACRRTLEMLESIEAKTLVGDEGCLWGVEIVRHAIQKAVAEDEALRESPKG